uniref:CLASP_N domain-containing protein n=1 Tax=Strongyloides papillosus TaxID=174720 RepID=A0A0N5BC29_STREA
MFKKRKFSFKANCISHAHIVPISLNKDGFNLIKKDIKPGEQKRIPIPSVNIYTNKNVLSRICVLKSSDDKTLKKEQKQNNNISSSLPLSSIPTPNGNKKTNNELVHYSDNERKPFKNEIGSQIVNGSQNSSKKGMPIYTRQIPTTKYQLSIPKHNVITSNDRKENGKRDGVKSSFDTSNKANKNLSVNGIMNNQKTLIKIPKPTNTSTLLPPTNNISGLPTTKQNTALIKKTIPCNIKKPITKEPLKYLTSLKSPTISTFLSLEEKKGNINDNILHPGGEELSKISSFKRKVEKVGQNTEMTTISSTINGSLKNNNQNPTLNYDTGNKRRIEDKSKDLNVVSLDNENLKLCGKICNEDEGERNSLTNNYDEVPQEREINFSKTPIIDENVIKKDNNEISSKSPSPYSISQNTSTSPSTSSIEGLPYPDDNDKCNIFLSDSNDKKIFDNNGTCPNILVDGKKLNEEENTFENVQLPVLKSPQIVARLHYEEKNYSKINGKDINNENLNYMRNKNQVKNDMETDKLVEELRRDNRLNKEINGKMNHYVNFSTIKEYQKSLKNECILEDDSSSLSSDISGTCDIFSSDDLSDSSCTDFSQNPPLSPNSLYQSNSKIYTKRHILTEKERMNELLLKSRTSHRSSAYTNFSQLNSNSSPQSSLDKPLSSKYASSFQLNYRYPQPSIPLNYNNDHGYVNNLNQLRVDCYNNSDCITGCHSLDRVSCIKKKPSIEKDNQNQLHSINLVKNEVIGRNDKKGHGLIVMNSVKQRPSSCTSNRNAVNEGRYQTLSINENKNFYYDKEVGKGTSSCHAKFESNYYNILDEELEQVILELEHLQFKMEPMDFKIRKIKEQLKRLQVYNSIIQKRKMMENAMTMKHPSIESLSSVKSKISYSSKESNVIKSKLSEIATSMKKTLTSNSGNPFKKAFKQKKNKLSNKNGDVHEGDEEEREENLCNETINLKNNLMEKDKQLTEMRLEALNKANEVEELKETIKKLESENLSLKIHSTINSDRSSNGDFTNSSTHNSWNSGNSNGNNNTLSLNGIKFCESEYRKVFVVNEMSGTIHCSDDCPKTFIGYLKHSLIGVNWMTFDTNICEIFQKYIKMIDNNNTLGINQISSILGYSIGVFKRNINTSSSPSNPSIVCSEDKKIHLFLKGDKQKSLDSLAFNTCISKNILKTFVEIIEKNRYVLVNGDISIMKDNLITQISNKIKEPSGKNYIINGHDYDICRQKVLEEIDKIFCLTHKSKTIISLLHLRTDEFIYVSEKISKIKFKESNIYVMCCLEEGICSNIQFTNENNIFTIFNIENNDDILKNVVQRNILNLQNPDDFLDCLEETNYDNTEYQNQKVIKFLVSIYKELLNFFSHLPSSKTHSLLLYKFLCPPSTDIRKMICWFSSLWNEKLVPYSRECISKAKHSPLTLSLIEEPLNIVGREWPWSNNTYPKNLLASIFQNQTNQNFYTNAIDSSFDPLAALIKIQNCNNENRKNLKEIDVDGNDKDYSFD